MVFVRDLIACEEWGLSTRTHSEQPPMIQSYVFLFPTHQAVATLKKQQNLIEESIAQHTSPIPNFYQLQYDATWLKPDNGFQWTDILKQT